MVRYDLNQINCKKNPKRVEVDFSRAIFHSVLSVFCEKIIDAYLRNAYNLVFADECYSQMTMVHICAAHMIKAVRTA